MREKGSYYNSFHYIEKSRIIRANASTIERPWVLSYRDKKRFDSITKVAKYNKNPNL